MPTSEITYPKVSKPGFFSAVFIFAIFLSTQINTNAQSENNFTIMAAGGSLKTCTSLSLNNCRKDFNLPAAETTKTAEYYQVTEQSLYGIVQSSNWRSIDQQQLLQLSQLLYAFSLRHKEPLSRREFINLFRDSSLRLPEYKDAITGEQYYSSLSDYDWFMLLDFLQQAQLENGSRIKEQVFLTQSKDKATETIFRTFVEMASRVNNNKDTATNILVMTSSARDSYDAVDFYMQVFAQAGAEVQWLPLDQGLVTAISKQDCDNLATYRAQYTGSVRRAEVFPDLYKKQQSYCRSPNKLMQLIKDADGIFINGGDQSLTRATLINDSDNPFMTLIREESQNGSLVVGGTSAGAAVQSGIKLNNALIPMISSGQSYTAIISGAIAAEPPNEGCSKNNSCKEIPEDALTYQKSGGLGLINTGIIDTHFSERARQLRLMQLAAETQSPIAVGVDETTAVLISEDQNRITYQVVGKHGVWFFQNATLNSESLLSAKAHYLRHQDSLVFNKADGTVIIRYSDGNLVESSVSRLDIPSDILRRDALRNMSNQLAQSKHIKVMLETTQNDPQLTISLSKEKNFSRLISHDDMAISEQPVSFSGLRIEVKTNK